LHWDVFVTYIQISDIRGMKPVDTIRTKLIDKILAIQNTDFLKALDKLVSSTSQADKVMLSSEQTEMLEMSKTDISEGRLITQDELDKEDKKWR
jgi:hypothetical protein